MTSRVCVCKYIQLYLTVTVLIAVQLLAHMPDSVKLAPLGMPGNVQYNPDQIWYPRFSNQQ